LFDPPMSPPLFLRRRLPPSQLRFPASPTSLARGPVRCPGFRSLPPTLLSPRSGRLRQSCSACLVPHFTWFCVLSEARSGQMLGACPTDDCSTAESRRPAGFPLDLVQDRPTIRLDRANNPPRSLATNAQAGQAPRRASAGIASST